MTLEELVNRGFGVAYHDMDYFQHCVTRYASGGECGTDTTTNPAICFFQVVWKQNIVIGDCLIEDVTIVRTSFLSK
ncbi:unnamed protein product [Camellia sinensis]